MPWIVHGTRPARAIALALTVLPKSVPKLFVSDANIYDLVSHRARLLPRLAVYRALFAQVPVALSLGLSNELALRLLGARTVFPLPIYAVDYARTGSSQGGRLVPPIHPENRSSSLLDMSM